MDKSALSKAQLTICEALGLSAKDLIALRVELGVHYLWFQATGIVRGSDDRPFAVRKENDTVPATYKLTSEPPKGSYFESPGECSYRLFVEGLRGEDFPTIEAALDALPRMGDELREAHGIRVGEGVKVVTTERAVTAAEVERMRREAQAP